MSRNPSPKNSRRTRRHSPTLLEPLEPRTLLSATAFNLTTPVVFNNITKKIGLAPNSLAQDAQGNIFGTTSGGGVLGYGTIFEIPIANGVFKVIAQFNAFNGFNPTGPIVVDSLDNIYGVATNGGGFNDGTLYELTATTHVLVDLFDFNIDSGSHPFGGITADNHGNLFGTTFDGGGPNLGTVFKYATLTHTFTLLHTFDDGAGEGGMSTGSIAIDRTGNLYGTTFQGGLDDEGTVFKITAGSNFYGILASFDGDNGQNPTGTLMIDSAGTLYGVTNNGGVASNGVFYVIPAGTANILVRASFDGDTGIHPAGNIVADSRGDIFGTAPGGGVSGNGAAWVLLAGGNFLLPIADFPSADTGLQPSGGLILTHAGNLLGTTTNGGVNDDGVLFQLTPVGPPAFGWVDAATTTTVQGWAYDPAASTASIQIAIYVDNKFVGNAPANQSRPDLVGVTVGGTMIQGAMHGFNVDFSQLNLAPGNHTVSVFALSSTGGVANPLLRTIVVSNAAPFGFFDAINSGIALGWVYDPQLGADPVTVKILVDGSLLNTTAANVSRPDVDGAVVNGVTVNGAFHGFSYNLTALSAGTHTITILATDPGHPDVVIGSKILTLT